MKTRWDNNDYKNSVECAASQESKLSVLIETRQDIIVNVDTMKVTNVEIIYNEGSKITRYDRKNC